MTEAYVGQIQPYAFNFAPVNWALCAGQILPLQQNTALFSILGANFGGNGSTNFGLPNMQGNVAVGAGQGSGLSDYAVGETAGTTGVTVTLSEMPAHTHQLFVSGQGANTTTSANNQMASAGGGKGGGDQALIYSSNPGKAAPVSPAAILPAGQTIPHNNMQPYLTVCFCICMAGVFPPRG